MGMSQDSILANYYANSIGRSGELKLESIACLFSLSYKTHTHVCYSTRRTHVFTFAVRERETKCVRKGNRNKQERNKLKRNKLKRIKQENNS